MGSYKLSFRKCSSGQSFTTDTMRFKLDIQIRSGCTTNHDNSYLVKYGRRCKQSFSELQVMSQALAISEAAKTDAVIHTKWPPRAYDHRYTRSVYKDQAKEPVYWFYDGTIQQADMSDLVCESHRCGSGYSLLGTLDRLKWAFDQNTDGNGPQLVSKVFEALWVSVETKLDTTTKYHPQWNGQVESFHKILVMPLRHHINEHQTNWALFVTPITYGYNTQVYLTTRSSSFRLILCRELLRSLTGEVAIEEDFSRLGLAQEML